MIAAGWTPDSYQSCRVLNAIRRSDPIEDDTLPTHHRERLSGITDEYEHERASLAGGYAPRNLPFYNMIRRRYPQFRWLDAGGQTHVETYHQGRKYSLLAYLLDLVPTSGLAGTARISRAHDLASIADRERYLPALAGMGACRLSEDECRRLDRWLATARRDGVATIVSPVCPDYSVEPGETRAFRFTFDSVGSGCGLAGMRLLQSIAPLHALFRDLTGGADLVHHVCVGDFEAFSADNLATVGATADEFVARNRDTAAALAAASPIPIRSSLFTDHCGGRDGWEHRYATMLGRFEAGAFGALRDSDLVLAAAAARHSLYERWHGAIARDSVFLRDIVVRQGAEYATMGEAIGERFANPLVIGADHQRMAPFYGFGADIPVLYLDRTYD